MNKTLAKELQGDFIPGGGPVDPTTLEFRPTREDEVFQCCAQTANDPQSGPIFCGRVAELVSQNADGYVAVCHTHRHRVTSYRPTTFSKSCFR